MYCVKFELPHPAFNWSAMLLAKLTSLHQIEADNPYIVPLAPSRASFAVRNGIILT